MQQNQTEKGAIALLQSQGKDAVALRHILAHSRKVQEIALRIANDVGKHHPIDKEFIRVASLLHDIGRFQYPPGSKEMIKHGIAGAALLRKSGFGRYARVAECHIGAGITKEDIHEQNLPLPLQDYVPITIEEKIIAHADNLVAGDQEQDITQVVALFTKKLGKKYADRLYALYEEIETLKKR
ncbi:HD domain-containing protein [Candidatus Woesearchaeota archaeon]|nr:HD domain-containing protein [Candidatus Woesearchaeota archaeon]